MRLKLSPEAVRAELGWDPVLTQRSHGLDSPRLWLSIAFLRLIRICSMPVSASERSYNTLGDSGSLAGDLTGHANSYAREPLQDQAGLNAGYDAQDSSRSPSRCVNQRTSASLGLSGLTGASSHSSLITPEPNPRDFHVLFREMRRKRGNLVACLVRRCISCWKTVEVSSIKNNGENELIQHRRSRKCAEDTRE